MYLTNYRERTLLLSAVCVPLRYSQNVFAINENEGRGRQAYFAHYWNNSRLIDLFFGRPMSLLPRILQFNICLEILLSVNIPTCSRYLCPYS
jgi:hypothetical protein